ncbi:MAG: acyltransferase [Nonomuraea sp.]|nr:acyltransferase [Nonomuraea sp.]
MKTEPRTATRLLAVDNLRIVLTVMVVLHHAAVTYGNIPVWFYTEPAKDPSGALLDILVVVDQSFFMGFFFMISGFFTPGSVDRKGTRPFIRDRLIRLGIPLLVFLLVLRPIVLLPLYYAYGAPPFWGFYFQTWDPGPMWFVEVLIVLAVGYALWRPRISDQPGVLRGRTIVAFALGLSVVTWLWRFLVPTGTMIPILGLPTPDFLPQYVSFFAVGLVAYRRGWYATLSRRAGWVAAAAAGVVTVALLPLTEHSELARAAWESTFAVSVVVALTVLFRQRFNKQRAFGRFLSAQAFTVYIIHPLVLVFVAVLMRGWQAPAIAKFAVLAAIALPVCWGLAYLVRKLPGARRIL